MPIPLGNACLVAAIGAGGKTTILGLLAQANRQKRVLLTTTTHIRPYPPTICQRLLCDPTPQQLEKALSLPGVTCAGAQCGGAQAVRPPSPTDGTGPGSGPAGAVRGRRSPDAPPQAAPLL